jgi:hypothetical protein
VSADGTVIVGWGGQDWNSKTSEAFHWSAQTGYTGLGGLSDIWSEKSTATGVSADGSVVVGYTPLGAFLWTRESGLQDLRELVKSRHGVDLELWNLKRGMGVSADGRTLVGFGERGSGDQSRNVGWVLRLPEKTDASFRHAGDLNQDATLNIGDVIFFLNALFIDAELELPCDTPEGRRRFLDVNEDTRVDIGDPISLATFLFLGGQPPLHGALCAVIEGCDGGPGCQP